MLMVVTNQSPVDQAALGSQINFKAAMISADINAGNTMANK
jgi:hypothetical protein